MSIRPDHWIQHMAQQQRMIEPFEPAQIRGAIISYADRQGKYQAQQGITLAGLG